MTTRRRRPAPEEDSEQAQEAAAAAELDAFLRAAAAESGSPESLRHVTTGSGAAEAATDDGEG